MVTKAPWTEEGETGPKLHVELSSWRHFHEYITGEMLAYSEYIWRGQRDASWKLETTLHRLLKNESTIGMLARADEHLNRFKLAVRGRRGPNPPRIEDVNEWWALGQHQGLATPLLDWTSSPFVALYFAFQDATPPEGGNRAIYALNDLTDANEGVRARYTDADEKVRVRYKDHKEPPVIHIVRPYQDENARLVSQSALFTRGPLGMSLDEWVENECAKSTVYELIKISIPDEERDECLRMLDRMNINHLSLFPDVYGASHHCNMALQISGLG